MLKKTSCIIVLLSVLVGVSQAQVAVTYSFKGKHYFTMNIHDDWRVNVGSEKGFSGQPEEEKSTRLISAMPNDGVPLWFAMWVPQDIEEIEGAEGYIKSLGLDLLTDVVITDRKLDTVNAMEVFFVSGTGKKEGETMDFHTAFFQLPTESVAIAIYIGPPETTSSHGEELAGMIHSLQPVIQ